MEKLGYHIRINTYDVWGNLEEGYEINDRYMGAWKRPEDAGFDGLLDSMSMDEVTTYLEGQYSDHELNEHYSSFDRADVRCLVFDSDYRPEFEIEIERRKIL